MLIVASIIGHKDDATGSIPIVQFVLDCSVLQPVLDTFHIFYKPTSVPGQSKDRHVKFFLINSDHVQVVGCISAVKKRQEGYLQLLSDGREGDFMPEGYLPFESNLWSLMGHDLN